MPKLLPQPAAAPPELFYVVLHLAEIIAAAGTNSAMGVSRTVINMALGERDLANVARRSIPCSVFALRFTGTRYQPHTLVEATETLAREGWIYPTIAEHFQLCPDNASFEAEAHD